MYFGDAEDEAEWIKETIQEAVLDGMPFAHQAVLFRFLYFHPASGGACPARGFHSNFSAGLKFYETAHVKDVLAHLKILANFKDELSWSRVFTLLPGIGGKTAENISSTNTSGGGLFGARAVDEYSTGIKYSPHLLDLKETCGSFPRQNGLREVRSCCRLLSAVSERQVRRVAESAERFGSHPDRSQIIIRT